MDDLYQFIGKAIVAALMAAFVGLFLTGCIDVIGTIYTLVNQYHWRSVAMPVVSIGAFIVIFKSM